MQNGNSKLLFVTKGLGIGGAQKALIFVANTCAMAGYDVSIISLTNSEPSIKINDNIDVLFAGYDPTLVNRNSFPKKILGKFSLLIQLRRKIRQVKPDIVIPFMSDIVRIATYSTFGMKTKIIGSERGNPLRYQKKQFIKYSKGFSKCDAVIFQTEKAASVFGENIRNKSFVIPNPSIPRMEPIEPHKGNRRKVISAAGRLHPQKRFDVLIEAFNKVNKKYPDYQLHIYGEGEQREFLQKKVDELALNNNVILKGEVSDVFANVNDSSMFVLSSDYEGIPNVLIEAMSIGIPCISTDCEPGGPRLLFDGGRRGLLVSVTDIDALANAICTYIENPKLANIYGERGLELNNELAPDVIGQRWIKVIESTLKK